MKIKLLFLISALIAGVNVFSQDQLFSLKADEGEDLLEVYPTPGFNNVYVLSRYKNDNSLITNYKVFNQSFENIFDHSTDEKYNDEDIIFQTVGGEKILVAKKNGLGLISDNDSQRVVSFLGEDFNGEINNNSTNSTFFGKASPDLRPLNFINGNYLISIGRKEGDQNYKDGNFKEMDVFMYMIPLDEGEPKYVLLERPKENQFGNQVNVHYVDNEKFILVFNRTRNNKKHVYRVAYYDYTGKILKQFEVKIEIPEDKGEFGLLNLRSSSFMSYVRRNSHGTNEHIVPYQFPTSSSQAGIIYDHYTDSFFLYGSVHNKKIDDELLLVRYDSIGNKAWEKFQTVDDGNFKYLNSANRYMTIIPNSKFIGLRVYSTKGKHYNNIYLFEPTSGELLRSKYYSKREYKKSNLFNHDAAMMGAWDPGLVSFLRDFKFNKEEHAFDLGYFLDDGFLAVTKSKKDNKYTFYKFKF